MKNIILGIIGAVLIIYSVVLCLAFYGNVSRKNELENNFSMVLKTEMEKYYVPAGFREETENYPDEDQICDELQEELRNRISSESQIEVHIKACDLEKGILSATVREDYRSITGNEKTIEYEKTLIAAD